VSHRIAYELNVAEKRRRTVPCRNIGETNETWIKGEDVPAQLDMLVRSGKTLTLR
jgi:hypothetical protein